MTVVLIALATGRAVQAQSTDAQAEAMFRQGRELMAAGKISEACAAFDASEKLGPTHSTMLNQANCHEKNGQLATAWGLFLEAERQTRAGSDAVSQQMHTTAVERAAKLEPRLSTLRIDVPDGTRIPGLEILRDGQLVDPATWDKVLPIDGGSHQITARAPGNTEWTSTITVGVERDAKTLEIPKLRAVEVARLASVANASVATTAPSDGGTLWSTKRKFAIGVAGGGVVALAVGTVLGTSAKSAQSDALALCPDPHVACENAARATELTTTGHNRAIAADVAFGIGAAAMVVAGVMWFTGAPESSGHVVVVPNATPGQLVLTASGRF